MLLGGIESSWVVPKVLGWYRKFLGGIESPWVVPKVLDCHVCVQQSRTLGLMPFLKLFAASNG